MQSRDRSAAEQRFEHAARLRDELDAVDWVVAPQRVMDPSAGDATMTGWCDGTSVRLEFRDGALCRWDTGPTDRPGAGTRCPADWSPFLTRNARLAADLVAMS